MKLRYRHINVSKSLKTDTRRSAVEYDQDGHPLRFEDETYVPAHVHIIEFVDGQRIEIHHRHYLELKNSLDPREDEVGGDSDAVYIKLDPRLRKNNVTYQRPVSKAALARIQTAISDETLPVG